jgi:cell division protein FtsW (lipid II flippase)
MNTDAEAYLIRQSAWVVVGLVCLFIVASIDYHILSEQIPWLYLGACGVLLYTLAFGRTVSGSQSWISLGPARFQPSEIIKLVVVIAMARYLSELRSRQFMTLLCPHPGSS